MKRILAVLITLIGVTAAVAVPVMSANGSTVTQDVTRAPSGLELHISPGAHKVSLKVPISSAAAKQLREPRHTNSPLYQIAVSPRVYCNGNGQAPWSGFNGNIAWGGNGSIAIPAYLDVWGTLWDGCGATAYLYLSYTLLGSEHNGSIGSASYYNSTGINHDDSNEYATYGNIRVDVCTNYNGWRCGAAEGP